MSDDQITVKVKQTNNNKTFDISILKSQTILELKKACSEPSGLEEGQQNLVYKGRILADEKLVSDYNIQETHTIILVKKISQQEKEAKTEQPQTTTTNQTQPTTSTQPNMNDMFSQMGGMGGLGGMGNMGGMDMNSAMGMMNNPQYQQMMQSVSIIYMN